MPARKLDDGGVRLKLREADATFRGPAFARGHARKPIHKISPSRVSLRHALVEFRERLKVLWLQVPVHEVNNLILKQAAWQDHVVKALLIYRADG